MLNLIDHLPRDSYFVEALVNDDEFGEQLLNMPDVDQTPRERVSEWSPIREGLARLEDAVHALSANVIAAAGAKPPRVQPVLRPITAADRARQIKRRLEHEQIVARVLPGRR